MNAREFRTVPFRIGSHRSPYCRVDDENSRHCFSNGKQKKKKEGNPIVLWKDEFVHTNVAFFIDAVTLLLLCHSPVSVILGRIGGGRHTPTTLSPTRNTSDNCTSRRCSGHF